MCQGDSGRPREHFGEGSRKVRGRFGGAAGKVRAGIEPPRGSQRQTPLWTSLWDSYNTYTRTL